ncbi:MAG: DUF4386 domain-containing protein [Candidatus Limnocylindrales bacterium]
MQSSLRTPRTVGILFLVSYASFIAGSALLTNALDASTDLGTIHASSTQVIAGVLLQFVNDVAVIGIAVLLYPFLKRYGESLALWYVGLKIIEAGAYVVARVMTLSLITVSEKYVAAGAADAASFEGVRSVLLGGIYWAGQMGTVAFILGGIALYGLLYRSNLIPRFISMWGVIAVVLLIPANVIAPDPSGDFQPAMLLFLPIVLNELFLAMWLIAKGFTSSAINPVAYEAQPAAAA